jgi:hypothetical protein
MANWLSALRQCKAPRVYVLLGIIILLDSCQQGETKVEKIKEIVEVLSSEQLLLLLLALEHPGTKLSFE